MTRSPQDADANAGDYGSAQAFPPTPADAIAAGYSIIPIRLDKKPRYDLLPKSPNGKATWKPYQERQPTADEITAWDKARPPSYAIVTGKISGIVTADFDGEAGRKLAAAWGVRAHRQTGSNGLHWDLQYPGHYVPTLNGKAQQEFGHRWPGLDVKGDAGYVIAFGRNENGHYKWLRPIGADAPQLLPDEIWEFLRRYSTNGAEQRTHSAGENRSHGRNISTETLIRKALGRNGGRNNAGFWLACQLRDHGYSKSEAWTAMLDYRSRCPETNSKGQREIYSKKACEATLDQAYAQPAREPWDFGNTDEASQEGRREYQENQEHHQHSGDRGHHHHEHQREHQHDHPQQDQQASNDKGKEQSKAKSHFVVTPKAVFCVDDTGKSELVCGSHLRVEGATRDTNGSDWGRLLYWTDSEGREKKWAMPMEMLAGDMVDLRRELLRGGVILPHNKGAPQLLARYISQEPANLLFCTPKLGWHDHDVYVMPDRCISQSRSQQVIFQGAACVQHYYRTAGTLEQWRERVSLRCQPHARLVFAVSLGFAAVLLEPLGLEGGGFHIVGPTSTGKSTMQIVAGSALGGGNGDHGFCRSWRHTDNALETVALMHNDSLLILDELREMTDPAKVETCVYMLSNGSQKGRSGRSGGTRHVFTWRLLFLSSGEFNLSEYAESAGKKIKGGAEVRLINLPADAGEDLGIFEGLRRPGETLDIARAKATALAQELKAAALSFYGTAIITFLERFLADPKKWTGKAKAYMAEFIAEALPKHASSEEARAIQRFAATAAGGRIATEMEITGWGPETAFWGTGVCFDAWIKYRGGSGQSDLMRAVRQVKIFLQMHGASRFQTAATTHDLKTGDELREKIFNRAGYWGDAVTDKGLTERFFLIFPEVFRKEVCAGFNAESVARELLRQGFLEKGDGKNLTKREKVPEGRPRFYVIRGCILEATPEGESDDMPPKKT